MSTDVMKDLLEALKEVEWADIEFDYRGDAQKHCPSCGAQHKNGHHTTCRVKNAIARAEAALAEPDGWIPWAGGKCPVPPDTLVDVKVKPRHEVMYRRFARNLEWSHDDPWCNHIDFYRIAGEQK